MPIICDSSALILYARIGRLELLRAVFDEVIIPPAVHAEVVVAGADRIGASEVASASWVRQRPLQQQVPAQLLARLHRGEAEVIALAQELAADLVLLDDRDGRRLAEDAGLRVTGSAGVLLAAKVRGIIPSVRPLLDALISAGLRLSDQAYSRLLVLAGE